MSRQRSSNGSHSATASSRSHDHQRLLRDRHQLEQKDEDGGEESRSISSAGSHSGSSITGSSGSSNSTSSCDSGDSHNHECHSCSNASEDEEGGDSFCCSHSHSSSGESSCNRVTSSRSGESSSSSTESSIEWIRESTDRTSGSLFYVKILDAVPEDRSSPVLASADPDCEQSLQDHYPHRHNESQSKGASATPVAGNKVLG